MEMKIQTFISLCIYACILILRCNCLDLGSVDLVGNAECLDCINKKQTFSGMRVGIACRNEAGMMKIRSGGKVEEDGRFRVPLLTSESIVDEKCSVVLHNGSGGGFLLQLCEAPPPRGGSCKTVETMVEGRHEVHLLSKLLFSSSTCTSQIFPSFPWYQPKLGPWKKKKTFLIFPFPPKCIQPFLPPYLPPICDSPPPPSIVYTTPPSPTPVFIPTSPPPPAFKNPPIFLNPPPPVFKNPPIFLPPPPPVFNNPPPPSPAFKNPPVFLPPPPPEFKNPPIFLPPPPIFKNPPVFETPFNPSSPPPPAMEFMPVPMIPKFLPPKFNKPCPPVYKGPGWFPPKNSGHPKFGFWFPVPP